MRNTLVFSILLNSLLAGVIGYMVLRLGGIKYVLYRLNQDTSGLYANRSNLFQSLPAEKGAIVFLGDSQIEQCEWSELLRGETNLPVINRGIVGDGVDGLLLRLPEISRHEPSKIFICLGINDLIFDKSYHDIELKYHEIIRKLRTDNRSAQIFVISVLPVNNTIRGNLGVENSAIAELNIRLQQIARSFTIPFLDLNTLLAQKQGGNLKPTLTSDGIHLNASGYLQWKLLIKPYLKAEK